ncbi:MAG: DNA cytosine methyltransferase [Coriobacteriales bacterium]|nr:DNA cytosine methyltransferase [Coriobacteriales bacterium]
MLENVKGIFYPKFNEYRELILNQLHLLGYKTWWRLIQSSDYGVSQLRPRALLVAIKEPWADRFEWPNVISDTIPSVGELLYKEMASNGWPGADDWANSATSIAPTLVGGSKKHGGADLGPTRARKAWANLGIDGKGIADEAPGPSFEGMPRLTVKMAALIQGFPSNWVFSGKKTAAYRQIGNAFPPPVAKAIGKAIKEALNDKQE